MNTATPASRSAPEIATRRVLSHLSVTDPDAHDLLLHALGETLSESDVVALYKCFYGLYWTREVLEAALETVLQNMIGPRYHKPLAQRLAAAKPQTTVPTIIFTGMFRNEPFMADVAVELEDLLGPEVPDWFVAEISAAAARSHTAKGQFVEWLNEKSSAWGFSGDPHECKRLVELLSQCYYYLRQVRS